MIQAIALNVVLVFGIAITLASVYGLAMPGRLIDAVLRLWRKPGGLTAAVVVRLLLGFCLLVAAENSRFPLAFTLFGILTLLAAIAIPLVGRERLDRFLSWWARQGAGLTRAWLLLGIALGVFMVWGAV